MLQHTRSRRLLLVATLLLLASAAAWWWLSQPAAGPPALPQGSQLEPAPESAASVGDLQDDESSRAQAQAPALPVAGQETRAEPVDLSPATPELIDVRGRLLDARGNAIGGFGIAITKHTQDPPQEALTAVTTTGSDGRFRLQQVPVASGLVIADPRWVTVRSAYVSKQAAAVELVVIAAPAVELAGTVTDASGSGVAGVELAVAPKSGFWVTYAHPLDVTIERKYLATSDGAGRFRFQRAPSFEGSVLSAQKLGFARLEQAVPNLDHLQLVLRLEPALDARRFVEGTVRLAQGGPAVEATVILGRFKSKTEADGRFLLKLDDGFIHPDTPLVAVREGLQAAAIERFGAYLRPKEPPPDPAVLVLGGPALAIQGHVVDEAGKGLQGWTVRLQNGLVLEQGVRPAPMMEHHIAGEESVLTGADGSFAIAGLMPRSYVIEAVNKQPLMQIVSAPISAGSSNVVLRLETGATANRVHGRVVDWNNRPIASVLVTPRLVFQAGSEGEKSIQSGVGVTTDEAGLFELQGVGIAGLVLVVAGEAVMTSEHPIAPEQVLQEHVLRAARRAHFQVHMVHKDLEPPLQMLLLDPTGKQESICRFTLNRWAFMQSVTLAERESSVYTAGEGDHTLVLKRDENEVFRKPIVLVPGDVQTIELR